MHRTLVTVADLSPTCRPNSRSAAGRQQVGKWGRLGLSCAGIGEAQGSETAADCSRTAASSVPRTLRGFCCHWQVGNCCRLRIAQPSASSLLQPSSCLGPCWL